MTSRRSATVPSATRRQFLAYSGAVAAALTAAGCSAPPSASASGRPSASSGARLTKIGLDYPFTQLPLYTTLVKLSTAGAKKHGVSLLTTNDGANADTQASNLNTWVARKVPAIVSFPMVFEATEAIAKAALDAGVNHFDNADVYGNGRAERMLARVLDRRRHELQVLERDTSKLEGITAPFPRLTYDEAATLLTDKGLPKRTPKINAPASPPRQRTGSVDAEALRRRLGGFRRGAEAGYRDVEAEIAERTGQNPVPGEATSPAPQHAHAEEDTGGTVEEASS